MRQRIKLFIFCACAQVLLVCCEENSEPATTEKTIHIVGAERQSNRMYPVHWRNGIKTTLPAGAEGGSALAVVTQGNDVHIIGEVYNSGNKHAAAYWKNGKKITIAGLPAEASIRDIYVRDKKNVLMVGARAARNPTPIFWKDGVISDLPLSTTYGAASCIFVANDVIYIGGNEFNSSIHHMPVVWINGVRQPLELPDGYTDAFVSRICVVENDVYATGSIAKGSTWVAGYWKNGTLIVLDEAEGSKSWDLSVQNGVVYVAGQLDNKPVLWKNGVPIYLSEMYGYASRIVFHANSMFVLGETATVNECIVQSGKMVKRRSFQTETAMI